MIFGLTVISTWYWCTDQARAQKQMLRKNIYLKIYVLSLNIYFKRLTVNPYWQISGKFLRQFYWKTHPSKNNEHLFGFLKNHPIANWRILGRHTSKSCGFLSTNDAPRYTKSMGFLSTIYRYGLIY